MKIDARLNTRDITDVLNKVKWYESYLKWKLEQFVSELAEVGITIAKENVWVEEDETYKDRSDLVFFKKEFESGETNVSCLMIATGQPYTTVWKSSKDGVEISAQVNPLLMAEFGSGWRAIEGHQGTFPNQHVAFMRPWYWYDTQGNKHSSYGSEPSRPLFKAKQEMERQILEVAERVFNE